MDLEPIKNCSEFIEVLNSKLEKGANPRYHMARIEGVDTTSDYVFLKLQNHENKYLISVEVQNHYALNDLRNDINYNYGMDYSLVVYDEQEHQILMYEFPEEDWYICHVPRISESWEKTKKLRIEEEKREIQEMEDARPVEGKEYYLCPVGTDKGLGYEVYASYDYVRLTNKPGERTPVVFEEVENDPAYPAYPAYHIRMTKNNYAGYNYFSCSNKGWIYLDQKKKASKFVLTYKKDGIVIWLDEDNKPRGYFKAHYRSGRTWLASDSRFAHDLYTFIPADKQ